MSIFDRNPVHSGWSGRIDNMRLSLSSFYLLRMFTNCKCVAEKSYVITDVCAFTLGGVIYRALGHTLESAVVSSCVGRLGWWSFIKKGLRQYKRRWVVLIYCIFLSSRTCEVIGFSDRPRHTLREGVIARCGAIVRCTFFIITRIAEQKPVKRHSEIVPVVDFFNSFTSFWITQNRHL